MSEDGPRLAPGDTAAVTGATGFIGGRLVERLVADGVAVTCLLRGRPGPALAASGAATRTLDLADAPAVLDALAGVSVLFHCAYDWADEDWNRRALAAIVAACRATGCRLVHVSSFVVYDVPPEGALTEEVAATPDRAGYAHVKSVLERDLVAAVRAGGLWATTVQPTIVYGPGSKPWTIDPVDQLRRRAVVLPDRGEGVCNAVHVDDVVDAMILAAGTPAASGRRYLVSGEPVSWGAFYEGLAAAAGAPPPAYLPADDIRRGLERERRLGVRLLRRLTRRLPGAGRGKRQLPDRGRLDFLQGRCVIGSERARRELGYAPRVDLARGMAQVADWLRTR